MAGMKRRYRGLAESKKRPKMKTWAALLSIGLFLLPPGLAHGQSMSRQGWGGARGGMRRTPAAQQPSFGQRPWSAQHPGFARSPAFARSPVFFHSGRFNRRGAFWGSPVFWGNQAFWSNGWGGGGWIVPWPVWGASAPVSSPAQAPMWAYCQNPDGFFPYVQDCPSGWILVEPGPPPPEERQNAPVEPSPQGGTSSTDIREQIARSRAEATSQVEVSLETAAGSRPTP